MLSSMFTLDSLIRCATTTGMDFLGSVAALWYAAIGGLAAWSGEPCADWLAERVGVAAPEGAAEAAAGREEGAGAVVWGS